MSSKYDLSTLLLFLSNLFVEKLRLGRLKTTTTTTNWVKDRKQQHNFNTKLYITFSRHLLTSSICFFSFSPLFLFLLIDILLIIANDNNYVTNNQKRKKERTKERKNYDISKLAFFFF